MPSRPLRSFPIFPPPIPWRTGAGLAALLLLAACEKSPSEAPPKPIVTEGCLVDCAYEPARRLVSLYCADCHAQGGNNESHDDAWGHAIRLDTYAEWVQGAKKLQERLDPDVALNQDPPETPMPPPGFRYQPGSAERDTLLAWLKRGSPNTVSGSADSAASGP